MGALIALAALTAIWGGWYGSSRIEDVADDLVVGEQSRVAAEAADALAARLDEIGDRIENPLILDGSGLMSARTPEALQAGIDRLARSTNSDEPGVFYFVYDNEGRVLAVDHTLSPERRARFLAHRHRPHPASGEVGVCDDCLRAMHSVTVHSPLRASLSIGADIDVAKFARPTLRSLVSGVPVVARLVDADGSPILEVRDPHEAHASRGDRKTATAPIGGTPWKLSVQTPVAGVAPEVGHDAHMLVILSVAFLALIALMSYVLVVLDRRTAARELEQVTRFAHQSRLATLGMLSASVSHEIRNYLTVAKSMVELARRQVTGTAAEDLDDATQALDRLADLSDDLRSFSRAGDASSRPFSLSAAVEDAVTITGPKLKHGPPVQLHLAGEPQVVGSRRNITQVVVNLLLNAADAMSETKGTIDVEVDERDDQAFVCVRDHGPGIPDEVMPHLFDAFVTTKGDEGTGLGLWLSQQIVREHDGDIDAHNTDEGASFCVYLPLEHAAATA